MKKVLGKTWILYLLAAMNFTHIVDFMIMMPLGDYLMKLFDITPQEFTVIVSAYTFSAGASGFLSAFFIDRFDRRTAILFTYIGFSLGTLSVALADSYWQLIAARILTGLFGGMIGALVLSIVSDLYSFKERGKAMGIVSAAFAVASVVGVPMGLFLASRFEWHSPFIFLGSLGLIIGLVAIVIFPSMTEHIGKNSRSNPIQVIQHIVLDKNQVYALAMGMIIVLGQFLVIPFIAPYMIRNVGFTEDSIALLYMFGGGAVVFTGPLIGKLTDRIGALKVFTTFLLLSAIPVLIFTNLPPVPMYVALIITTFMFIFINGRMIPMQTLTTAAVKPETRGSFMSVKSSLQQLGAAIASLVAGSIIIEGPNNTLANYPYVGIMAVTVTLLSLLIAPRLKVAEGN
jgi:predicted MFS family arabinose efflux permease